MIERFQKIKSDSRFLFNVGFVFTNGKDKAAPVHAIKTLDQWFPTGVPRYPICCFSMLVCKETILVFFI